MFYCKWELMMDNELGLILWAPKKDWIKTVARHLLIKVIDWLTLLIDWFIDLSSWLIDISRDGGPSPAELLKQMDSVELTNSRESFFRNIFILHSSIIFFILHSSTIFFFLHSSILFFSFILPQYSLSYILP